MKKLRLILVACGLLLTIISSGQTTLTFRLANPNITFDSGTNYLVFDVQAKAAVAGSFVFSGQGGFSFANANLATTGWFVFKGPLLSGAYGPGGATQKYQTVTSFTGSPVKFNVGWVADAGSIDQPATSARFNEVTTGYQTLVTVWAPITNSTGMAGVDFDEVFMNGQQFYKLGAAPWFAGYVNPNLYDADDFMNLFLGRIYANAAWSQIGGAADWSVNLNTSVWNGNAIVAGGAEAKATNLRVHGTATLTIPANGKLTVSNITELNTVQAMVIQSDATGTGSFISGDMAGVGTALVQRYMIGSPTAWHLISSPVGQQSIADFVNNAANNVAYSVPKYGLAPYDNSVPGWVHYTNATLAGAGDFIPAKGYEVLRNTDGPGLFTGAISTGLVPRVITHWGVNMWWNLVGNPYPSAVNANSAAGAANFLTANAALLDVAKTGVYIWNQPMGTYDVINQASPAAFVPVGQAFFIKSAPAGGAVDFTAAMRTHSSAAFKAGQSAWPSIKVNAVIAGASRNAQIYYIPGTTVGVDQGYDAGTFEESASDIILGTRIEGSDVDFAIQSLPVVEGVVALAVNAPEGGAVNFTVEVSDLPSNTKVYLEDRLTGKFTRMDENGSFYSVNVAEAATKGRFFIHTTQGTLGVIDEVMGDVTVIAMPREHKIRILGTETPNSMATIYELNGAVVGTQVLPNVGENEMPFMPVANGVYLIKVQETGKAPTSVKINWIY